MALSSTEVDRIRYELGYPTTRLGAEPYITYAAVFDKALIPYLTDVGSTSTTTVAASSAGANVAVTVASNPTLPQVPNGLAFVVGTTVSVDVGPAQEQSVILAVTGLAMTLNLSNAHGTAGLQYPVVLAGAEQVIRDILLRLSVIAAELIIATKTAGISKANQAEIYSAGRGTGRRETLDKFQAVMLQRDQARQDLSEATGIPDLRRTRRGGGRVELY